MTYSPFKMKGHTLPGIKQSPAKHASKTTHTTHTKKQEDEANLMKTAKRQRSDAIKSYVKKGVSKYDATQAYLKKVNTADSLKEAENRKTRRNEKSPAKCPLIAALPAITGAIGAVGSLAKKKEQ